jgi:hypothetical protein
MSFPSPITALKLRVSVGSETYEQPIPSASMNGNSFPITASEILTAFNTHPPGTSFTPSIVTTHIQGSFPTGDIITYNGTNFISRKITPTFSLASIINKFTTDSPFSLPVNTNSTGVLSYESSNILVATVNSSGLVTLKGVEGITTITVSLAASSDESYAAGSASTTLNVTLPPIWRQLGADIDGIQFEEESGSSVSLSSNGRTLAIGAPSHYYGSSQGRTRIFDLNTNVTPNQWIQRGLDIIGTQQYQLSGSSVSISSDGNSVAIGAPIRETGLSGSMRVYYWNTAVTPNAWTLRGQAIVITGGFGNEAGHSVSLSSDGTIVAIGAPKQDDIVYGVDCGKTYVYEWKPSLSNWVKRGTDITGLATSELTGWVVTLSSDGNTIATGGKFLGQARVYDWNTTLSDWEQRGSNIDTVMGQDFRNQLTSISLSSNGNTIAVGKGLHNNDTGKVTVYDWNTTSSNWEQRGSINRVSPDGKHGYTVCLSPDGNSIATGAIQRGDVRVFDWNTQISPNAWTQRGLVMTGETVNDISGVAISLSSDGNTVAIGAPKNAGSGNRKGHTRVYKFY